MGELVLDPKAAQLAGLAASSGRSLFVFGPPGNGKSSLGRQIHAALHGNSARGRRDGCVYAGIQAAQSARLDRAGHLNLTTVNRVIRRLKDLTGM